MNFELVGGFAKGICGTKKLMINRVSLHIEFPTGLDTSISSAIHVFLSPVNVGLMNKCPLEIKQ